MDEPLVRILKQFVKEERGLLDETYDWDIPERWPQCAFERGFDSCANANFRLKRALSAAWHERPTDRAGIERWYIKDWGGIRRNSEKTLKRYALATDKELVQMGIRGIASWSKILVVRDPERFAIYDARVGAALNALQIARHIEAPLLFPQVQSQNTVIQKYQANEASIARNARPLAKRTTYTYYLGLMERVARDLSLPIDTAEMALFAKAPQLANEALQSAKNSRPASASL